MSDLNFLIDFVKFDKKDFTMYELGELTRAFNALISITKLGYSDEFNDYTLSRELLRTYINKGYNEMMKEINKIIIDFKTSLTKKEND